MTDYSVSRRQFGRRLALGTAAVSLTGHSSVEADKKPKPATPDDQPKKKMSKDADKAPPPGLLLLEIIRQKYPDKHLDEEDVVTGIYRELRSDLARGERLSKFPLKNSDEPATHFAAWRAENE